MTHHSPRPSTDRPAPPQRRPRAPLSAAWLPALALLLAVAVAPTAPAQEEPAAEVVPPRVVESLDVPRPDLSAMQPAARARVESIQAGLEELLARQAPPRREVGQAFGFLGQTLHALDLPAAAARAYDTALRLLPQDPRWPYFLALAKQSQGDLEGAVAQYRRFLEGPRELPAAHVRLGDALLQLGRLDEADAAFQSALESAPEEVGAVALHGLGRVAVERGEAEQAVELLSRALALQPDATTIHYPLAQAHRRLGNEQVARYHLALRGEGEVAFPDPLGAVIAGIGKSVAFEVVRDLAAAEDFDETDFLGFVTSQLGGSAAAAAEPLRTLLGDLAEAGAPAVQRGRLHAALGSLLARAGDDPGAVEAFERALELAPDLVDARLRSGNALAREGRFDDALERFDQVLARRPESAPARVQRAAVRANLGQLEEARTDLEAALDLDPENAEAHLRLAGVEARLGEREAAAESYRRAADLAATPRLEAEAWTALADLSRRTGDARGAAEAYSAALDADPRHGAAIAGLAGLLGQAGRYRESATLYRRLVELEPDNRVARMGEVTALVLAGADELARQRMEVALERNPDDLAFKDVLARHLAAADERSVRDGERAVALAEELYDEVPTPESMETLAMAHAEAGEFDQAVEWQQRLLDTLGDEVNPQFKERLQANLERYARGEACCVEGGLGTGAGGEGGGGR